MSEDYLEPFRAKAKIRGNTFDERLTFVLNRWNKVVSDSADDDSMYRQAFSDVHKGVVSSVESIINSIPEENIRTALTTLLDDLIHKFFLSEGNPPPGILDGMSHIVSELELVLQ